MFSEIFENRFKNCVHTCIDLKYKLKRHKTGIKWSVVYLSVEENSYAKPKLVQPIVNPVLWSFTYWTITDCAWSQLDIELCFRHSWAIISKPIEWVGIDCAGDPRPKWLNCNRAIYDEIKLTFLRYKDCWWLKKIELCNNWYPASL